MSDLLPNLACMDVYNDYITNKHTKKLYRGCFERFLQYLSITDPNYLLSISDKELYELLKKYILHLRQRVEQGELKANSIKIMMSGIGHFFTCNDKTINWKKLSKMVPPNTKGGGDKAYTKDQIRALLSVTNKVRNKFLLIFMASTGARVGAIPDLRLEHIQQIENCYYVTLYNDDLQEYVSFMTPECSKLYNQYLQARKSEGELLTQQSPLFRYDYSDGKKTNQAIGSAAIYDIVARLVQNSGIQRVKKGRRYDIAVDHGFRKFFATCLKSNPGISHSVTERLLGHEEYLEKSYFLPDIQRLFTEYKKAIEDLTIDDIESKNAEIKTLQEQLAQKYQLQDQIARLEQIQSNVLAELERLKALNPGDNRIIGSFSRLKMFPF